MLTYRTPIGILLASLLAAPLLCASTPAGDRFLASARARENRHDWTEALVDYQKALAEDPADPTYRSAMEQARAQLAGRARQKPDRLTPPAVLTPAYRDPMNLRMANQSPRVLFETVAKLAGIDVLFDPGYRPGANVSVNLRGASLEEALDFIAVLTRSSWKPVSPTVIQVTNDNPPKR